MDVDGSRALEEGEMEEVGLVLPFAVSGEDSQSLLSLTREMETLLDPLVRTIQTHSETHRALIVLLLQILYATNNHIYAISIESERDPWHEHFGCVCCTHENARVHTF